MLGFLPVTGCYARSVADFSSRTCDALIQRHVYKTACRLLPMLFVALLSMSRAVHAEAPNAASDGSLISDVRDRADEIVDRFARDSGPGLAVGVFERGRTVYSSGTGLASLEDRDPITSDTVFCLGSVSKQFTAFAAQLLIADGKMSLETDARDFLPYLSAFPEPIRAKHLIYHTSGLKDVWYTFLLEGVSEVDAIEQGHIRNMIARQHGLNFPSGTTSEYSNSGYAALADLVAAVSGQDFDAFMESRVFRPLGMTRTTIHAHVGQVIPHAAASYAETDDAGWRAVPFTYASYGTSNVWSSVNDLGKWFANLVDPIDEHRQAVDGLYEFGQLDDGTTINYASGMYWQRVAGHDAFAHSGHDQDFVAFSIVAPEDGRAISVLANARLPVRDVAIELGDLFWAGGKNGLPEPPDTPATSATLLSAAPGTYLSSSGLALVISREGRELSMRRSGEEFGITMLDEKSFFLDDWDGQADGMFVAGDDGSITTVVSPLAPSALLRETYYERLPASDRMASDPAKYVGRYYSAELDAVLDVGRSGNMISIGNKRTLEPLPLVPVASDIFTMSWAAMAYTEYYTFRFFSTTDGRFNRFIVSNYYANNIEFVRVE